MSDVRFTMKQFKMIAIDLDGTLLCPRGTVTAPAKDAVHRALDAGLLVCFATGRNWTECRAILDAVGHYDSAVLVGGAVVYDTRNHVTLHRALMRPELARELSALMEDMGHAVLALQDHHEAGVDYLITDNVPLNEATTQWMRLTSATHRRHGRLADHPHTHTIRVGIVAPRGQITQAKQTLEARYGDALVLHDLKVPSYDVEVLEAFDPAVNKWAGIQHVAARHGIRPEEIIAIGDDVNDLPMIRHAGLGVAMGNARPEVRAVAKRVIGPNTEEGLAAFLHELIAARAVEPLADQRKTDAAA